MCVCGIRRCAATDGVGNMSAPCCVLWFVCASQRLLFFASVLPCQVVGLVTRKDLSNISSHTAKRACRPDESETEVVQYILPKDEIE